MYIRYVLMGTLDDIVVSVLDYHSRDRVSNLVQGRLWLSVYLPL